MSGVLSLLKTLYRTNKKVFVIAVLIALALVVSACISGNTGGAPSAPSGPIGGGCG